MYSYLWDKTLAVAFTPAVVEALLDGGANVMARNPSTGLTPLQVAKDPFVVAQLRARMQE